MPVNPVGTVAHVPVEQSAESSEEQRRRERGKKQEETKATSLKSNKEDKAEESTTPTQEEAALSSQYIDSHRVIDLMSHRSSAATPGKNPFQDIKDLTEVTDDKNRKKINKTL